MRGLAPPQPLVAILRRIDWHGDDGRSLVVHHDRDPALLYPELAERGWRAEPIAGEPGEVRLLLSHGSPSAPKRAALGGSFLARRALAAGLRCRFAISAPRRGHLAARLGLLVTADALPGWHGGLAGAGDAAPVDAGHAAGQRHRRQPAAAAGTTRQLVYNTAPRAAVVVRPGVALLVRHGHGASRLAGGRRRAGDRRAAALFAAAGLNLHAGARHGRRGAARLGAQAALALLLISAAALVALDRQPLEDRDSARGLHRVAGVFGFMGAAGLRPVLRAAADVHARPRARRTPPDDRRQRGAGGGAGCRGARCSTPSAAGAAAAAARPR